MRTAVRGSRVGRLKDRAIFTIACMSPFPALAPLVEGARKALDKLLQAEDVLEAAHEACLIADATVQQADLECDDRTRDFAQEVRLAVRNDTHSPLYRSYFPGGSTVVTQASPEEAVEKIKIILSRLPRETNPRLTAHVGPLTAACTALEEAVASQKAAELAERTAVDAIKAEKLEWIRSEVETYNRLRIHFRENPKLAEHFFRKDLRPRPSTDDVEDEGEEEQKPGAGTATGAANGTATEVEEGTSPDDRPPDVT